MRVDAVKTIEFTPAIRFKFADNDEYSMLEKELDALASSRTSLLPFGWQKTELMGFMSILEDNYSDTDNISLIALKDFNVSLISAILQVSFDLMIKHQRNIKNA